MGKFSKSILYKKQINELLKHEWKIVYDQNNERVIIINEYDTEISNSLLGFVGSEINDYINRREEETFGEKENSVWMNLQ